VSAYFVGADVGTAGCRISIYDEKGKLTASAAHGYALHTPRPGWAEQDPEEIFQAFRRTLAEALGQMADRRNIRALCFATTLHSIFPISSDGLPLHRALIWADSRAQPYLDHFRDALDTEALYARTACPLHAMYPLAKLLWFRHEEPEKFAEAARFISIKEFLVFRLTGRFMVDRSVASGTGMFDVHELDWDRACLDATAVSRERLSPIFPTTEAIQDWPTASIGLPEGTSLVLGAGDGVLSTLGAAAVRSNQYTLMIGSSGAVRRCVPAPTTDSTTRNWCYNLTDRLWVIGGAINNGGLALKWVRDNFTPGAYEHLDVAASTVNAGSDGLIFLPFFSGERSPHWNSDARGVLFGLTLNHTADHVIRATMEGVAFSLYSVFLGLQKLETVSADSIEFRASGSVTRSAVWLQIIADVFGHPIVVPGEPEGTAFGAAALAMIGTGALNEAGVGRLAGAPRSTFEPDAARHLLYQELFAQFENVYRSLIKAFADVSAFQRAHATSQTPR